MYGVRMRRIPLPELHEQEIAAPPRIDVDPFPRREGTSRDGWQPTADALLTMNVSGNRSQATATVLACFRRLRAQSICR